MKSFTAAGNAMKTNGNRKKYIRVEANAKRQKPKNRTTENVLIKPGASKTALSKRKESRIPTIVAAIIIQPKRMVAIELDRLPVRIPVRNSPLNEEVISVAKISLIYNSYQK